MRCEASCGPRGGMWREAAVQAACRAGLVCRSGAGHGEERTENMKLMVVTLEVSKLSGWLNDAAPCRKGGIRCGASCGPGAGRRGGTGTVCWAGLGYIQIGGRARVR